MVQRLSCRRAALPYLCDLFCNNRTALAFSGRNFYGDSSFTHLRTQSEGSVSAPQASELEFFWVSAGEVVVVDFRDGRECVDGGAGEPR